MSDFPPSPSSAWVAPSARRSDGGLAAVTGTVAIPGSKSETNRALVLAAVAEAPSTLVGGLDARDTRLMRDGLRALGVEITEHDPTEHDTTEHDTTAAPSWTVVPGPLRGGSRAHPVEIDCGLAGTVMRFLPALAANADGWVRFDGDPHARERPVAPLLDALRDLGATVITDDGAPATRLPFLVGGAAGALAGGATGIDASSSSQYVSALLLAATGWRDGLRLTSTGPSVPSAPHLEMTLAMLRERGVAASWPEPEHWRVAPGPVRALDAVIEPDLSNASPFLAAAVVTGGTVTVPHWPAASLQPGDALRDLLAAFGAHVSHEEHGTPSDRTPSDGPDTPVTTLTVTGPDRLRGVDLDLSRVSELTPVIAAVAACAPATSRLRGVAHIRGHETDRLAALASELGALGAAVEETADGLVITGPVTHPGERAFATHADHRMAHAGAVCALVLDGLVLDDVACTAKTLPGFASLWSGLVGPRD